MCLSAAVDHQQPGMGLTELHLLKNKPASQAAGADPPPRGPAEAPPIGKIQLLWKKSIIKLHFCYMTRLGQANICPDHASWPGPTIM